jgi:hypothetical protein
LIDKYLAKTDGKLFSCFIDLSQAKVSIWYSYSCRKKI